MTERDALKDALEAMVWQFAYRGHKDGRRCLHTGGLSALEEAFEALGWGDPRFIEEGGCEYPGCNDWATCGTPSADGYKQCCTTHFTVYDQARLAAKKDGEQSS